MIKLKNVKVCPLYNPNFTTINKYDLCDMVESVPIVANFEINSYDNMEVIGMVLPHSDISIEDGYITSDILIKEEYKDYEFKNYECNLCNDFDKENKVGSIKNILLIEFGKGDK